MDIASAISNRHTNWAALVDARAARLEVKRASYVDVADDARCHLVFQVFTGRELKALLARAAFSTWLDGQALPAAPDPQPLPRLHQVVHGEERCEMCGKLVGVPRGEHWRECEPF